MKKDRAPTAPDQHKNRDRHGAAARPRPIAIAPKPNIGETEGHNKGKTAHVRDQPKG